MQLRVRQAPGDRALTSEHSENRARVGHSRRASALTGLLASLASHLIPGPAAAQVVVSPVALSGAATPAGGNYGRFDRPPVLNASGQVAFFADLTGASSTSGVFAGTPGSIQAAALKNAAAPGGSYYYSFTYAPTLNSAGQVAFWADLTDAGGSGIFGSGIYVGEPGSVRAAAVQGTAAPSGGNYTGFGGVPLLNGSGQVAFKGYMTGGSSAQGLFVGAPGSVQAVALSGSAAPAGGNYSNFPGYGAFNPSGRMAFVADLTGGSSTQGLFAGVPGNLQAVAMQGSSAPAGGNFGALSVPVINAAGQVAFLAHLTSGLSASGIFAGAPGSLQAVALQGAAAPSGGNYSSFSISDAFPVLNAAGQIAFRTNLNGGTSTSGIFAGTPGSLHAIVLEGMLAPAGNGAAFSGFIGYAINGLGQVAFVGNLTGAGVTGANNRGLYASTPGGLVKVVRVGDMIDVGNGTGFHTVANFGWLTGAGGEDGFGLSFNDSGMLVYQLVFTDGTSGVFTSTVPVPEPSSAICTLVGLLAAARFGKRFRNKPTLSPPACQR
jgi:hypothetical protein